MSKRMPFEMKQLIDPQGVKDELSSVPGRTAEVTSPTGRNCTPLLNSISAVVPEPAQ